MCRVQGVFTPNVCRKVAFWRFGGPHFTYFGWSRLHAGYRLILDSSRPRVHKGSSCTTGDLMVCDGFTRGLHKFSPRG